MPSLDIREWAWTCSGQNRQWWICKSNYVFLLRMKVDSDLNFEKLLCYLCNKANRNIIALSRLVKYSTFKTFELFNLWTQAFIESQFKYCPHIWIFHSRQTNKTISKLLERALRLVYDDGNSKGRQRESNPQPLCS